MRRTAPGNLTQWRVDQIINNHPLGEGNQPGRLRIQLIISSKIDYIINHERHQALSHVQILS